MCRHSCGWFVQQIASVVLIPGTCIFLCSSPGKHTTHWHLWLLTISRFVFWAHTSPPEPLFAVKTVSMLQRERMCLVSKGWAAPTQAANWQTLPCQNQVMLVLRPSLVCVEGKPALRTPDLFTCVKALQEHFTEYCKGF